MRDTENDLDAVRTALSENAAWCVWVIEYGMTHSFMRLALHPGTYPRHLQLECSECLRFEGDLRGGPYTLDVRTCDWHGTAALELRDVEGRFRLICGQIVVGPRVE